MAQTSIFKKKYAKALDKCALCDEEVPEGRLILKHDETGKIICLQCITEFALVE